MSALSVTLESFVMTSVFNFLSFKYVYKTARSLKMHSSSVVVAFWFVTILQVSEGPKLICVSVVKYDLIHLT